MKQRLLLLLLLTAFCVKGMSQGPDNIPVEGSKFYMEKGIPGSSQTVTRGDDNGNWTFKSVVENCFDLTKKDKEAWLMTADSETKLKVTFEYKTVDERHKIESAEVLFLFYNGDDLFNDGNAVLITDEKITGTFTKEVTEKSVTLHMKAPEVFPDPDASWYAFYVVLGLKFKGLGEAMVARQIGISRNGLFLLHGLNSNRQCFFPFREYLLKTAKNYFVNQIYIQDYSSTNTSSFQANTHQNHVVKNGLKSLSDNLFEAGIASTKYDMVGHSMGGILERLYIQEVDDKHTNRLITLNTPHFGSGLGNVYDEYDKLLKDRPDIEIRHGVEKFNEVLDDAFSKDHSMQAVKDLAKNSPAIQKLASKRDMTLGIPVCTVGSEVENWQGAKIAMKESFCTNFPRLASILFFKSPRKGEAYLDKMASEGSDCVVSVESQKGGCDKSYIYRGTYGKAMHCNVTEWDIIHEELNKLLTATNTYSLFTTGGFGEPSSVRTRGEADEIEFVTNFEEPKSTSFIKIEAKKVDGADYTHELKLTTSDDVVGKVAFCLLDADNLISDYQKDVMHFDMSGFEGEKWIYAFGRTNYDALVFDSVKVTLGAANGIKLVEDNAELRYALQGNILEIKNVTGPYSIAVYNSAGQMLAEMDSNPSNMYALPRNKGLLVINVRSNKGKQFLKVVTK